MFIELTEMSGEKILINTNRIEGIGAPFSRGNGASCVMFKEGYQNNFKESYAEIKALLKNANQLIYDHSLKTS